MSFYGLEIAKTGLFVSQKAINLAGHNIANASTVGYTRQRVVSEAIDPAAYNTRFAVSANGAVGGGAQTQSLEQVRNSFIDKELRRENSDLGYWSTRMDALDYIQTMFDETDSSALTKAMNGFIDALEQLSKDPNSAAMRANLRQSAITLTGSFHNFSEQLAEYQTMQNDSMATTVLNINDILSNIAAYNKSIAGYELSGEKANDLRDKLNVQIDKLSTLVNIEYSYDSSGLLSISTGGQELLNHVTVNYLDTVTNPSTGLYDVVFKGTGAALNYTSGELAAYKQIRDGNSAEDMGVPYLMHGLDLLAQSLAREMNAIHSHGYTLATATTPSVNGINLFEVPAGGYGAITAGNFSLSFEVLTNLNNFAASYGQTFVSAEGSNANQGDNRRALQLFELCSSVSLSLTSVSSFQGYLKGFMVDLGIEAGHAQTMLESQGAVVENLEMRKESISGVSVDEEMVDLIKSQQMYAASSRIMTAIDESLDILINRTGLVGRG